MPEGERRLDRRPFAAGMEFVLMAVERKLAHDPDLSRKELSQMVAEYRRRARRLRRTRVHPEVADADGEPYDR